MIPVVLYSAFIVAMGGLLLLVRRNARAQQARVAEMQAEVAIGDEVVLSAGIFGTVRSLEGDRVRLEIAENTVITVARQVVVGLAPETEALPADEHHPDD
ncbi:MAG TPA: preprotein translocase subunit YajC [Marmoricola sp.]|nr:preprotein translocase subunit YajC [Marmoricola sp.]